MIEQLPIQTPVGTFDALAAGPMGGREVLLLHGFPQGAVEWESQLLALAEAGHRAVAPDQRGYSPDVRPATVVEYQMDELVSDVLRIADALGWARFDLVGHDWGAAVAWVLADRHPQRLRTLTAVSVPHPVPFAQALRDDADQRDRSAYLQMFQQEGVAEQILLGPDAAGLRRMLQRAVPAAKVDGYVERMLGPGAMTAALNWYRATRPEQVRAGVVTVPTLYVWGTEDIGVGRVAASRTGEWVSGGYRFAEFEGVSHWVPEEAAGRLSAHLLEHLARHPTQPPDHAGVPDFPFRRTCPFDPPAEYATLRAQQPVSRVRAPDGHLAWLVTRYDDVRRLLVDPRVSSDRHHPNMPLTEEVTPQTRHNIAAFGRALIGLDPPEHGPRRRMLTGEFTVRRMQALRPHVQQTVDNAIDDLLAGPKPADLVSALALTVPTRTLCELLGLPYAARELIQRSATAQLRRGVSAQQRQRTSAELREYVDKVITDKEERPTDDLLGRLIVTNRETRLYDHDLLVGLTMLLVVAGHETTASMIALGVTGLLTNPEQLAKIVADPTAVGMAVEELLRYFSVVDALPRVATADIDVGGVRIPAGDGLLFSFASADWDGDVFPEPSMLDTSRNSRGQMAFGYGIHQCIGQNLARLELEIVFRTLFDRIPGLRLAVSVDDLPFKKDSNIYGMDHLPVTW